MKHALIFALLILPGLARGQDKIIALRWGVGTFDMSTQKKFRDEFVKSLNLPMKPVDNFPPYFTFGLSASIKLGDRMTTGIWYDYLSTGGRADYRDYSGHVFFDQDLHANQFGIFYQVKINRSERWELFGTLHLSMIWSKAFYKSELTVGTSSQDATLSLKSVNFGLRPGLMIQRKVNRYVFQGGLGYEVQTHTALQNSNNQKLYTPASQQQVSAQWDGLRATLGIGLLIAGKKDPVH